MLKAEILKWPKRLLVYFIKRFDETKKTRKAINRAVKCYATNRNVTGYHILNGILRKQFKMLPQRYAEFLQQSIHDIYHRNLNEELYEDIKKNILLKTVDIPAERLSIRQWQLLRYLFVRMGLLSGAMAFRQKAVERAYNQLRSSVYKKSSVVEGFKAAIDNADVQFAEYCLDLWLKMNPEKNENVFEDYFMLMNGKISQRYSLTDINTNFKDSAYKKYLQGKTVAVVGPAESGHKNGTEIDEYDIIVRIGYKGVGGSVDEFGKRVDVSYYGDGFLEIYMIHDNCEFIQSLDFANFKSNKFKKIVNQNLEGKCRRFLHNPMFFSGSPTMVQCALYDILQFNPSKVKLFNLNFNMSRKTHYNGYHKNDVDTKKRMKKYRYEYHELWGNQNITHDITGGFAHHDHISQLRFTKRLWKNNSIEVDETCAKVLEMNEDTYLKTMEDIHIKPYLLTIKV